MASRHLVCRRGRFFKSIFTISKLTGFFPYHLVNDRFQLSMPSLLLAIIVFVFATFHVVRSFYEALYFVTDNSWKAKASLGQSIFSLSMYFILIATWTTSSFRRHFINDVLSAMDEVDYILYTINPWRPLYHSTIGVKEVLVVMLISLYLMFSPKLFCFAGYHFFIILGIICMWLNTYQFSLISYLICIYVSETCASLKRVQDVKDLNRAIKTTRALVNVYNRLCNTALLLGKGSEKLLAIQVTCTFIGMVVNAFFAIFKPISFTKSYIYILLPTDNFMEAIYKESCILTMICFANVWHVSACSSRITKKVEEFNFDLYRIMIHDKSKHLLNDYHLRLHVLNKREVIFTACGLFNLDYTLLLSIMASVTTYIVIVKQFDQV